MDGHIITYGIIILSIIVAAFWSYQVNKTEGVTGVLLGTLGMWFLVSPFAAIVLAIALTINGLIQG
jgi:hypothetical protein